MTHTGMTHTRGPWTIDWSDDEGNDGVTIESPDGPIAFRVLEVDAYPIAAAPELLALARKIASSSYQVQAADLIDMARSTLADAERRLGA